MPTPYGAIAPPPSAYEEDPSILQRAIATAGHYGMDPLLNFGGTMGSIGRYGVSPERHQQLANSGFALGIPPEEAAGNPLAKRAESARAGSTMWGQVPAEAFLAMRRLTGAGAGEGPEFDRAAQTGLDLTRNDPKRTAVAKIIDALLVSKRGSTPQLLAPRVPNTAETSQLQSSRLSGSSLDDILSRLRNQR